MYNLMEIGICGTPILFGYGLGYGGMSAERFGLSCNTSFKGTKLLHNVKVPFLWQSGYFSLFVELLWVCRI